MTLDEVFGIKRANARRIARLKEKVAEAYRIAARISGEKLLALPVAKQLQFAYAMDRWRKVRAILEDDRHFLWDSGTFPEERANCVRLAPLTPGHGPEKLVA